MTRSVLFDTETTGLEPHLGHRVVEIAALELINDLPTGKQFHALIDPERDVPDDAVRVHGFTNAHLAGKPRFADIAEAMLTFFGSGPLIAHNAPFDFGFVDAELSRLGLPRLDPARMIDTLALARNRFPGMPNTLDALCRRFGIDLSERTKHNALLDCRLTANIFVELTGGRQRGLSLAAETVVVPAAVYRETGSRTPRSVKPTVEERAAHRAMIERLNDPVWRQPEPDGGSGDRMGATRAENR